VKPILKTLKHLKKINIILALILLNSCEEVPRVVTEEKHVIVNKFKVPPVGVHEEISPRYKAVLENGDTVPVNQNSKVGDTITYRFISKVER
jgi:uncharacterized protein YcfL